MIRRRGVCPGEHRAGRGRGRTHRGGRSRRGPAPEVGKRAIHGLGCQASRALDAEARRGLDDQELGQRGTDGRALQDEYRAQGELGLRAAETFGRRTAPGQGGRAVGHGAGTPRRPRVRAGGSGGRARRETGIRTAGGAELRALRGGVRIRAARFGRRARRGVEIRARQRSGVLARQGPGVRARRGPGVLTETAGRVRDGAGAGGDARTPARRREPVRCPFCGRGGWRAGSPSRLGVCEPPVRRTRPVRCRIAA